MNIKRRPRKIRLSAMLMIVAIILIGAFQLLWLYRLYGDARRVLETKVDIAFRDVIYQLQMQKILKDSAFFGTALPGNPFGVHRFDSLAAKLVEISHDAGLTPSSGDDSLPAKGHRLTISIESGPHHDSPVDAGALFLRKTDAMQGGSMITTMQREPISSDAPLLHVYRFGKDTAKALLSIGSIDSAYRKELHYYQVDIPYIIRRLRGAEKDLKRSDTTDGIRTKVLFVGASGAYAYQAIFDNPMGYLLGTLKQPIAVSLILLAFTTASFVFMYRNLLQQQKLAAIKNEFISNMTHELKTPIATVNVAVEALRRFGALDNPERAREYLDISAIELQRLSMLVDKVLKLSMFENRQIELNTSPVDLYELALDTIASMKLQFDKAGADIRLTTSGDGFTVIADRTHISSVVSNLLDNALKYSKDHPIITIHLTREKDVVLLRVSDNGVGIPAAYRERVFEKFFRVPSGDHHNIKGYGLGLSYVHHIVMRHKGAIFVESEVGVGSSFNIKLPFA